MRGWLSLGGHAGLVVQCVFFLVGIKTVVTEMSLVMHKCCNISLQTRCMAD